MYYGIDFETFGTRDIKTRGLDNYVSDPAFSALICSIAYLENGRVRVMTFDFVQRRFASSQILAADLPAIKGLEGCFASAAAGRLWAVGWFGVLLGHAQPLAGWGFSPERMAACRRAISTAQRAQSAPLSCMRTSAWSSFSVVRMPLAIGTPVASCTSMTARQLSLLTTSKW